MSIYCLADTLRKHQELVLEVFFGAFIMSQTFSAVSSLSASLRRRSISFCDKSSSRFLLKNEQWTCRPLNSPHSMHATPEIGHVNFSIGRLLYSSKPLWFRLFLAFPGRVSIPGFSSRIPSPIAPPRYTTDCIMILILTPISQDTNPYLSGIN